MFKQLSKKINKIKLVSIIKPKIRQFNELFEQKPVYRKDLSRHDTNRYFKYSATSSDVFVIDPLEPHGADILVITDADSYFVGHRSRSNNNSRVYVYDVSEVIKK